ncbi:MAG TPA: GTP pyrophosphokinase, partial [Marinilabiliales bacterium]|nr:GTP pyrophosphokinase [Marinilabiliales bacterium]
MKKFTVNEKKLILRKFNELLQLTESFTTAEQRELIRKAFNMAYEAHANMRRKSGEPYILHPIAVAKIATHEIGLGTKSVLASLLHDVVEDT